MPGIAEQHHQVIDRTVLAQGGHGAKEHPDKAARVQPIFITVDPARDTPAKVGEFAEERCGVLREAAPIARALPGAGEAGVAAVRPEDVFDAEWLEAARVLPGAHGPSLLPELIAMYLGDEAARLTRMGQLAAERAEVDLAQEAHGFAGNAAAFGAVKVRAVALELERQARAANWAAVAGRLAALRAACAELREEMRRLNLHHT